MEIQVEKVRSSPVCSHGAVVRLICSLRDHAACHIRTRPSSYAAGNLAGIFARRGYSNDKTTCQLALLFWCQFCNSLFVEQQLFAQIDLFLFHDSDVVGE